MTTLQLGPLAFPVVPLLWLAALVLALTLAPWLVRRRRAGAAAKPAEAAAAAERAVWMAALLGFGSARAAFVAGAWPAYRDSPFSVLDLRDGGFALVPGLAVAALWLLWRAWRGVHAPALRLPLAGAATAALAVALGGAAVLGVNRHPDLPALALQPLPPRADAAAAPGLVPSVTPLTALVQGGPAVVNLWATWCAPCRVEMPVLAEAARTHRQVRFLFVNQGEAPATVHRYLAAQPFVLDGVWLDPDWALGPAVGSTGLPTTLFIDREGRIVERHMGVLNAAALRARLQALN